MRIVFGLIILVHGLIHLIGFLKGFQLAEIEQLMLPVSRQEGLLWLLACLLFVSSGIVYFLRKEWWWMVSTAAVILSQVLIFLYWQDAKFGTIANIIVLAGCILGYGSWSFNKMVEHELEAFLSSVTPLSSTVTDKKISTLPPVVQRWMERAKIAGKEHIHTVHLKQTGQMKTSPDGSWMPVRAEQYVRTENPGFIWIADVRAAPYIHLAGRDKYEEGKGHMLIKLLSLYPVASTRGRETDQGSLLRYLAEMVWYPSAALRDYITWEEIDSTSARATMRHGGVIASGTFGFNGNGEVIRFEAMRYYDRKEGATLEPWVIDIDENSYVDIEDIRIPRKATVTWKLAEGDFTWYKVEVTG